MGKNLDIEYEDRVVIILAENSDNVGNVYVAMVSLTSVMLS